MKNQLFISFYFIFNIFIIIRGNDHDNKYVTYETPQGKEFFLLKSVYDYNSVLGFFIFFSFCDFLLLFSADFFLYIYILYIDLEVVGTLSLRPFQLLDYVSVHCGFFLYS